MSRQPPFDRAQPVLRGAAVVLRPARPADAADVLRACRDPETQRWTGIPVPYGGDDARRWVEQTSPALWDLERGGSWVLCRPGGTAYDGSAEIARSATDPARAEVGFSCAPWARRRGLTTAALRLVCGWGFDALGLARIEWRAYAGNDASRRLAERVGFTVEGLQRSRLLQRGVRRDAWVAALLPGELREG